MTTTEYPVDAHAPEISADFLGISADFLG